MDIVVKGRRTDVTDRFRAHVTEKLAKLQKLDGKINSVEVEVSKEQNPRQADHSDRIEITCRTRGPVIRAEAAASDPYGALDVACGKLEARLRRAADRRRVHHGGKTPTSVALATADLAQGGDPSTLVGDHGAQQPGVAPDEQQGAAGPAQDGDVLADGPMVLRQKVHQAKPMTLDQALYEMELVGHDFFLFVDEPTGRPSVVYRRRAYDYGVISLEME